MSDTVKVFKGGNLILKKPKCLESRVYNEAEFLQQAADGVITWGKALALLEPLFYPLRLY